MGILMVVLTFLFAGILVFWKWYYTNFFYKTNLYRRYNNLNKNHNIFKWSRLSLLIIIILIYVGIRWIPPIVNIIKDDLFIFQISEYRSANISMFLMLDLCSLLGILLPITLIFDKKNRLSIPVSFLAMLGGFATILFTTPDLYKDIWDAKTFFIGNLNVGDGSHDEPLMFTMHFWMVLLGINHIIWSEKITLKDTIKIVIISCLYAAYIAAIAYSINIETHVTAMVKGDFVELDPSYYDFSKYKNTAPSYEVFMEIYGTNKWQLGSLSAWISFTWIVLLMILLKDILWWFGSDKTIIINSNKK